MKTVNTSSINNVLGKHWSEEPLTPNESEQLTEWRSNNSDEFERMERLFSTEWSVRSMGLNVDAAWHKVSERISSANQRAGWQLFVRRYAVVAAAAMMFMMAGLGLWYGYEHSTVELYASADECRDVILPDASVVTIDRSSSVRYRRFGFKRNRSIALTGQAFFDVSKDAEHPFEVNTSETRIRVLGTSFNVNNQANGSVRVDVRSGIVELAHGSDAVRIEAGESAIYQDKVLQHQGMTSPNRWAWKERRLVFKEVALPKVLDDLEAFYNVHLECSGTLNDLSLTTTFTEETIDEVLTELELLLPVSCHRQGDTITIKRIE